jgi:hypothetical protein
MGSARALGRKLVPSQVQVVQLDVVQAPRGPGGELLSELGADPAHRPARQRGLRAERLGQRRLDIPG